MIDMRFRPYHLPQVNAPYNIVIDKLDDEGINYEIIDVDPNTLNASQGVVLSDVVSNVKNDNKNPIWVDTDNNVLDGHHRFVKALVDDSSIRIVKIGMSNKDACRLLNRIQDIYDYDEQQGMEEVVTQNIINANNDSDGDASYAEFLESLEDINETSKNPQMIKAYRKGGIMENSTIGNFFTLNPSEGFDEYEIDFENLLDTDDLDINYSEKKTPIEVLCSVWFPHINFDDLSKKQGVDVMNLKNKAVSEKARKNGYDGIKYGDKLLQGFK